MIKNSYCNAVSADALCLQFGCSKTDAKARVFPLLILQLKTK